MAKTIAGFSKLTKAEKIGWLAENYCGGDKDAEAVLAQYQLSDKSLQKLHDGFSENTIGNYVLPMGIAPNFLIDGKMYAVPMVIEESSVVAAASSAAKFWQSRGGFHTHIIDTQKVGHISFTWGGDFKTLQHFEEEIKQDLIQHSAHLTANMEARGGGLRKLYFKQVDGMDHTYQLMAEFETCNSMGANFINTVLETYASCLEIWFEQKAELAEKYGPLQIVMSILSNYTPECTVKAWVTCPVSELTISNNEAEDILALSKKFKTAVDIARSDVFRATTHNKGIYNGIDAVVMATGNDFRAIEASGHAYAARSGKYQSLSRCELTDDSFYFELEVPLALGTVGGLTALHPLSKLSLEILGNPDATTLMSIIASTGLAQNFAALRSLVTTGIQKGHMKMHLKNILAHLAATEEQALAAVDYFSDKVVSHSAVRDFLESH
ncbi:MAG: hydroxymethylglutaryl-CoA reductase, degradative [Saprospiraceae bacterium]|nr:hydroxymethylglutaryl-CoA reductase, degradative [Saprospiraceae bacterium]MBK8111687.1 hydroxymethylglutaryl-CoA reductase, degradative [Saprospiraceae bacterium]MBK8851304.1 hydroxymethylglutaryl-CoA reductase, degradative [Saprospiraceae bacterium]MBK9688970.1 hydroxymethylglutaryl-CoA reductase, degradative [Saprospiraceae bacterium]